MKKQLSILLLPIFTCTAILPLVTSCSISPTPLNALTYALDSSTKEMTITGFQSNWKKNTKLNLQPTYTVDGQKYAVTEIGDAAFYYGHLKDVILPDTIKRIDNFAFAEQNCPHARNDHQSDDLRDKWVVNYNLSKCNNLETIGDYAFHYNTVNKFKLPKNNNKLLSLGEDSFSGIRFWNNLDFSGFKAATTIGEWEFYAAENGKGNYGGKKIILPLHISQMRPNAFTWSDGGNFYLNSKTVPTWINDDSSKLGRTDQGLSFFMTNFQEFHVQKGADLNVWKQTIEENAEFTIPFYGKLPAFYHIGKLIADLNPDGTVGDATSVMTDLGFAELYDIAVKAVIELVLKMPAIWSPGQILADYTDNIPEIDMYIDDVDSNYGELMFLFAAELLQNDNHPFDAEHPLADPWINKMVQCETFTIWDRVFKYE